MSIYNGKNLFTNEDILPGYICHILDEDQKDLFNRQLFNTVDYQPSNTSNGTSISSSSTKNSWTMSQNRPSENKDTKPVLFSTITKDTKIAVVETEDERAKNSIAGNPVSINESETLPLEVVELSVGEEVKSSVMNNADSNFEELPLEIVHPSDDNYSRYNTWDWRELDISSSYELYLLRWETSIQKEFGEMIASLLRDMGAAAVGKMIQHTFFAALASAVFLPALMLSITDSIDNTWTLAILRADLAGKELAQVSSISEVIKTLSPSE